ncbi:MAG TPA: T9SS type A sorting domain-containing protein, partial [Rhodothermia bacterium]|nr:T9SS type A sorting domain-containing protein [Rhodothermia bacterium]
HVSLTAYDLLGRRVANIADEPMTAGWRTVDWNTGSVSNGVYVVRLQAGGAAVSAKIVVVK